MEEHAFFLIIQGDVGIESVYAAAALPNPILLAGHTCYVHCSPFIGLHGVIQAFIRASCAKRTSK